MQKLLSKFEELDKYIIATILLAIPLYPKFPLINIANTYVSVRLEDFLLLISLILLILINRKCLIGLLKDRVVVAITLFIFIGLLSCLSAVYITHTVNWQMSMLHWGRRIEYMSTFFLGLLCIKKRPINLNFYLKLIPLVIFFCFIYGLGQRYFNWPIVITQNEEYSKGVALRYVEGSHINSTFAGHYDLATYLVFVLPIILSLTIIPKRINIFYLFIYFSGIWLLVNTASRISFVSYVVSILLTVILIRKFKRGLIIIFISLLFIGFSSNLISRYQRVIKILTAGLKKYTVLQIQPLYAQENNILRREATVPTPTPIPVFEDRSTSIRLNVEWPRAIRAFIKNPLLGTGYSSITLATDNDYLRSLGETGFLGFSSFF